MKPQLPFISLILWIIAATDASAAEPLEARVRAGLENGGEIWVGQQVGLTVDILTTGFTFAKQRIHLPEVTGALVLEDAVTTINLGENIDGKRWQILRYRYPLFVQRPGRIEVPPIHVAFEVSAGYGREGVAFDLYTSATALTVRRPPGVRDFRNLVTATQFELDVAITPAVTQLQVGDALTRTITRSATGVSGMAFPPMPELTGVTLYPDEPLINDRSNRGELRGERVDAATFVLQAAGEVVVPAIELQWWDPIAAELRLKTIPELRLEVAPNPALSEPGEADNEPYPGPFAWGYLALAALLGLIGWGVVHQIPHLQQRLHIRAHVRAQTEPARFKRLQSACRKNDARLAYNALLSWTSADNAPAEDLLRASPLKLARERAQQALINKDAHWRGSELARATRLARHQHQRKQAGANRSELSALNPTAASPLSSN